MKDILVIVMAHSDARGAVERHRKYWEACGDVVYITPTDAPLPSLDDAIQIGMRKRGHSGTVANQRVIDALGCGCTAPHKYILFLEYDAIVLEPPSLLPADGEVWAPVFSDTRSERGFAGTVYTHPPLFMTRATCRQLVCELHRVGADCEGGFWDRMIGYAIETSDGRVTALNMWDHGMCYARNPIEGEYLDEACQMVKDGARWLHGIKTEHALNRIEAVLNK